MKVLVTGAAGYIGSVLCAHLLESGHGVIAADNLMYGQTGLLSLCADPGFEFHRGDVRDSRFLYPLIDQADAIVPLAAIVGAPACDRNREDARTTNLEAVQTLLKRKRPSHMLVFPTTNSGYGTTEGTHKVDEESPLNPISLYGRTKVEAERAVLAHDSDVLTLRLATVFGASPRMRLDLLVNTFVWEAVTTGYLVVHDPEYKRNYVHVQDVARCIVHCLANFDEMRGRPYNVGLPDANLSKWALALKVRDHVKYRLIVGRDGVDPDERNYVIANERMASTGFDWRWSVDEGIEELKKVCAMLPRQWRNA